MAPKSSTASRHKPKTTVLDGALDKTEAAKNFTSLAKRDSKGRRNANATRIKHDILKRGMTAVKVIPICAQCDSDG